MTDTPYGSSPLRSGDRRPERAAARRGPVLRLVLWGGALLGAFGLFGAAWAVPQIRSVLRDSFVERQPAYLELYFAKEPWFDGDRLVVPLDLVEHGETGGRHAVEVQAQDRSGRRLAIRTNTVTTKPGAQIRVDVRLSLTARLKTKAELVDVTLPGHPQRLRMHLR